MIGIVDDWILNDHGLMINGIPSGQRLHNYGKIMKDPPLFTGTVKLTVSTGPFSRANG